MTFGIERRNRFGGSDRRCLPLDALPQRVLGGVALAFVATLCTWTVCVFADTGADQTDVAARRVDTVDAAETFEDRFAVVTFEDRFAVATFEDRFAANSRRGDKLAVLTPSRSPSNVYASLFDRRFSLDRPLGLAKDAPPTDTLLPPPRDRATKTAASTALRLDRTRSIALRDGGQAKQIASDAPANRPTFLQSIFEKLFGKATPVKLAYATTDDAGLPSVAAGRYDQWTAVYDISAHTVYMPDGRRLEAHSGLGDRLDDPSHPDERMHGVTPPNIYDLALRESPFHGVRALRLIPQDEDKVFGRRGLLAHTYMLGPNGDSNGCVSIKNYDAFLQAYLNHDIKRLAVVTRLE